MRPDSEHFPEWDLFDTKFRVSLKPNAFGSYLHTRELNTPANDGDHE